MPNSIQSLGENISASLESNCKLCFSCTIANAQLFLCIYLFIYFLVPLPPNKSNKIRFMLMLTFGPVLPISPGSPLSPGVP